MSILERLRSCITNRSDKRHDKREGLTMVAWLAAGLMVGVLAVGCGDDDDDIEGDFGTAQLELGVGSSINNAGNRVNFADADGMLYTLMSARLVVDQIELELPDGVDCSDVDDELEDPVDCDEGTLEGDELTIDGPFVVDLVDGTTTPELGTINIPALNYDEIDVEVDDIDEDDDVVESDDVLIGNTFVGEADFEFENQKRELSMEFSFDTEAEVDDPELLLGDGDTLVVQFDAAGWLADIPVTTCLQQGDLKAQNGLVVLDAEVGGQCDDADEDFERDFRDAVDAIVAEGDGDVVGEE